MKKTALLIVFAVSLAFASAVHARTVRIGVFLAGEHIWHSGLQSAFSASLPRLVPDSIQIVFTPDGYRSANWNRDTCRIMAKQLTAMPSLDLILALGPWTVEDLLEAGCKKPIVAMYQVDPRLEGLADTAGVPVAENLTVQVPVGKIERDIAMLTQLMPIKKLGFLYFPSGQEAPKIKNLIDSLGKELGFEAVTAEGYNVNGTYAFFKAYSLLDHKIDALYLMPSWGLDPQRLRDFIEQTLHDGIPVFSYEGRMAVERGALASNAGNNLNAVGWYSAWKAAQIIMGKKPSSLPTMIPEDGGLILNEGAAYLLHKEFPEEILSQADILWPLSLPQWSEFSLTDAVRRAQDQNPGYLAKLDALTRAGAKAAQAWSQYLPSLTAAGGAVHVDDHTVTNGRDWYKNDQLSAGLTLEQPLFSLRAVRSIQLAAKDRQAAAVDADQAQLDLEYGVSIAYLNYIKTLLAMQDQLNIRRLIDYNLAMAKTKLRVGLGSETETNRWSVERLRSSAAIYAARSDFKVARILFNALLNQPWDTPFRIDTNQVASWKFMQAYARIRPYLALDSDLTRTENFLVTKGLGQNPRMRSSTVELDKQRLRLSANTARYFPDIGFRATYRTANELRDYPPSVGVRENTWSLGAAFQWPLFLGFDRSRERQAEKARLSELEYTRDNIRLDVMAQITSDLSRLISEAGRASALQRSDDLAREQIRMVLDDYEAGKVGYLDCLDAAHVSLSSSLEALDARISFFETASHLLNSLGISPALENSTPIDVLYDRLSRQLSPPPKTPSPQNQDE